MRIGLRGVAKSRENGTESARVSVKRKRFREREMGGSRARRNRRGERGNGRSCRQDRGKD